MHKYPCPETDHIDAVLNDIDMRTVLLSKSDCAWAASVGQKRRREGRRQKLRLEEGFGGNACMETDIDGAAAELAFCRWMGIPWAAKVNTFHEPDVDPNFQIRSTRWPSGRLIFRPNDPPDHLYVLLLGSMPKFTVQGFIPGAKCRQIEWIKSVNGHPPAWWVPQDSLEPASMLIKKSKKNVDSRSIF